MSKNEKNFFQLTVFKLMLLRCILVFSSKRSSVAESRAHTNLSGDFLTCMTSFYEHTHSACNRPPPLYSRAQHSSSSSRFFFFTLPSSLYSVGEWILFAAAPPVLLPLQSAVKNENVMQWWLKRLSSRKLCCNTIVLFWVSDHFFYLTLQLNLLP